MKEIDGWKIKVGSLYRKKNSFNENYFCNYIFESMSKNIGVLIYDVAEIRMGWEVGRLAVFKDKLSPLLLENPKELLCFSCCDTVQFHEQEEIIYIKILVRNDDEINIPFLVLDFNNKRFSYLKMINALPYRILVEDNSTIRFEENYRDNRFDTHDGKSISLNNLKWYSFDLLDKVNELYFKDL